MEALVVDEKKIKTVLAFSGPSGGHLFPAQAFAEAAHADCRDLKIVLVTSIRAASLCEKFPVNTFSEIAYLPEFGTPAGFSLSCFQSLLNIPLAIIKSAGLLIRYRPDLCIGFGSFVSYFGMLFASWRGIPTLIHEQNQMPGKATHLLCRTVQKVAVSFPETALRRTKSDLAVTGLPIRREIRENRLPEDKKKPEPFTILICGGSQGSAFLNQAVLSAWSFFSPLERKKFAVIHITGISHDEAVQKAYQDLNMSAEVYPFFEKIWLLYNRVHMVISRAGANSSFEQALYGLPTIFVPYPYAGGHQNENARYFAKQGAAEIVTQSDQTGEQLAGRLKEWSGRPKAFYAAAKAMKQLGFENGDIRLWNIAKNMLKLNTCNS